MAEAGAAMVSAEEPKDACTILNNLNEIDELEMNDFMNDV